jgi:hypothetical protein
MDKRKIKVTKSPDGKVTITRNKFGSGYKKDSILLNTTTVVERNDNIGEMINHIMTGLIL